MVYNAGDENSNPATIYHDLSFESVKRSSLRLISANDPQLTFPCNQLVCIDLLLLNVSGRSQSVLFERIAKDANPLSVHKLLVDNQSEEAEFEIQEGRSLCLKVLFFTKMVGVFPLKLFRVVSLVGGKRVEVEVETPDVIIEISN